MKKQEKGMTLTEILIVVSILVILITLIVAAYRAQILKGRDAKRKGDLHLIQEAVEEYEKDNDCYPLSVVCKPNDTGLQPYLSKIPCDPTTKDSYYYEPEVDSCPGWYRIFADLENTKDKDYLAGIGFGGAYSFYVSSPNAPIPSPAPTFIPTPSAGPTSTPPGGSGFWACFSGQCKPISGPEECSPNYGVKGCYDQCTDPVTREPQNECTPP